MIMKNICLALFTIFTLSLKCQNMWSVQNYKKGTFLFYSGSGSATRHVEQNYFNSNYNFYLKSPYIVLGTDYCFGASSDAYWGAGIYLSSGFGKKEISSNSQRKTWINSLVGVHVTHHSKWFVTKKIDLCSGYLIGFRYRNYGIIKNNELNEKSIQNTFRLAAGITATLKYYFSSKTSVYMQGGLGYNVDLLHLGVCYKIGEFK